MRKNILRTSIDAGREAARRMRAWAPAWMLLLTLVPMLASCASGELCKRDAITGTEQCQPASSSGGEAIGTAVAAGAAWGVVGCKVNGCPPPFRCSADGRVCERIACAEGRGACPAGYQCDPEDQRCK
jgi:hypothetical protein